MDDDREVVSIKGIQVLREGDELGVWIELANGEFRKVMYVFADDGGCYVSASEMELAYKEGKRK